MSTARHPKPRAPALVTGFTAKDLKEITEKVWTEHVDNRSRRQIRSDVEKWLEQLVVDIRSDPCYYAYGPYRTLRSLQKEKP